MNWTEEAQTRTETEPQFNMMELKAHELSGYSVSSKVLLQDSAFGLEKFLMTLFARAIAWFEDFAFLQGNGVGKPQGILTAPAAIAFDRQLQQSFANVGPAHPGRPFVAFGACQASHAHARHRRCVAALYRINPSGIMA